MQPTSDFSQQAVPPQKRIKWAFLQLEFSIKLSRLFENREIDKESFDSEMLVSSPEGRLFFPQSSFNTYEDLILASQNVYSTSLGLSAIALEKAYVDAGILNDPSDRTPKGDLRSFVYMLRCAFAHDLMYPKWKAKSSYARVFNLDLGELSRAVDVAALNGSHLELSDFGGMRTYLAIKDMVLTWLGS